jgi:hypothetical protein
MRRTYNKMFTNKPTAVFNRRYQASAAAYLRPSFFCDVMRRRLAVSYRRFGKMSVTNYQTMPPKIPEEGRSQCSQPPTTQNPSQKNLSTVLQVLRRSLLRISPKTDYPKGSRSSLSLQVNAGRVVPRN